MCFSSCDCTGTGPFNISEEKVLLNSINLFVMIGIDASTDLGNMVPGLESVILCAD